MTMMQLATAQAPEGEAFYNPNGGFNMATLREWLHGSVIAPPATRHPNFRRYLKILGLITMVGVSANLAMPMGKALAAGDFSLTCNNIQIDEQDGTKKAMLSADCKRMDPRAKPLHSSINLNDYIGNIGFLTWATHGDFQETCGADRLQVWNLFGAHEARFTANCQGDGPFGTNADTSLDLDAHITNIDGNLKYVP
jgi:hypothetical protein